MHTCSVTADSAITAGNSTCAQLLMLCVYGRCAGLQERLAQQKAEKAAKGEEYNSSYKPQRSKDEAKERRKAILSNIGEVRANLLQVSCSWLSTLAHAA
jgi:hypothetical protein